MTATAYPLSWPPNMPRSRSRETGKFKTSHPDAGGDTEAMTAINAARDAALREIAP